MEVRHGIKASDPWVLVLDGRWDEAYAAYTAEFERNGGMSGLPNRAIVSLLRGEPEAALADLSVVLTITPPLQRGSGTYLKMGTCRWLLGRPSEAVAVWREALDTPYTDAAGGVESPAILLDAAERLGDDGLRREALALLRRHARRKLGAWPGSLVPFLLGRLDQSAFLAAAQATGSARLAQRWRCQADFYCALRAWREGDSDPWRAHLRACAAGVRPYLEHEWYLARWEVAHDFPMPPFP